MLTRLPSHTVNPSPHSSSSRRHPSLHDRLSRTGPRATRFTLAATLLATAVGFASAQSAPQAPKKVSANWTWAGWGGGGYFWSNAWDPADPNTLYLGGDVCGIYKSTDRGKSWFFVNNGLHEYGVYGLAAAPSQSGVLYCMTPNGMARTTNGGAEWVPLEETMRNRLNLSSHRPGSVRPIAVHPTNPKALYAGSAKGYLYRSADGGESWQEVDYLAPLRAAPQKPIAEPSSGAGFLCATMKAGSGIWDKSGRLEQYYGVPQDWSGYEKLTADIFIPAKLQTLQVQLVAQTGANWAWQSSPGTRCKPGEWTTVEFSLSGLSNPQQVNMTHIMFRTEGRAYDGDIGVDAVTLHGKDGSKKVIGDWNAPGTMEGWRVSKAGDAPLIKSIRSSSEKAGLSEAPVGGVAIARTNPSIVFVANNRYGVFRSTDAGKTWQHVSALPSRGNSVAIHPRDPRLVYAAMGGDGAWASKDGGETWTRMALAEGRSIREIVCDPRSPKVLHVIGSAGWNGFVAKSTDGGATWKENRGFRRDRVGNPTLPEGGGGLSTPTNLALSPTNPDLLFISANWNNVFSEDGGETWVESSRGADITCFHDLRIVDGKVYGAAMDEGTLVSEDDGKTWRQISPKVYKDGLSGHQWRVQVVPRPGATPRVISTVSPWQGAKVWPNGVLVTDDYGKTLIRATGLPDKLPTGDTAWEHGYARALALDPRNPDTVYVAIDGKNGGGIFRSTDGGESFARLPAQPGSLRMFYGLAVDPTDSKRLWWGCCGNEGGVWTSPDAGESWQRTGCPDTWTFNLEVTPKGTVLAGGSNLWKSTDKGATWKQLTNLPGYTFVGIAVDPADENRIWTSAVSWGGAANGKILESTDGGKSWVDITGDIPYNKPLVLRYDPAKKTLWAAGVGCFKLPR